MHHILWIENSTLRNNILSEPQYFEDFTASRISVFKNKKKDEINNIELEKIPSVVFVHSEAPSQGLEALDVLKIKFPQAVKIFWSDFLDIESIRKLVNEIGIYKILSAPVSDIIIKESLKEAIIEYEYLELKSQLIKNSSKQLKELEELNSNLEKLVNVRLEHIDKSKLETEENLKKLRNLTLFINELSQRHSFEEIIKLIKNDVKKFHGVKDPVLVIQINELTTIFFSFSKSEIISKKIDQKFHFPKEVFIFNSELSRDLSNVFGRPFLKILGLPIETHLLYKIGYNVIKVLLCFENELQSEEVTDFLDFLSDRIEPLSLAIERLLLGVKLKEYTYRWETTFDNLKEPISIIDVEYNLLRSNKKFAENYTKVKCFENFSSMMSPCDGCPVKLASNSGSPHKGQIRRFDRVYEVHTYPIQNSKDEKPTTFVNLYIDITRSRELYLKLIQGEKMSAIGMLAGNIAHELNNPLTGIRSLAQVLIQQTIEGTALRSDLIEIEKAASRSQNIIKNLIEFSLTEKQELMILNLEEAISKTLPFLKTLIHRHRLELDLNAPNAKVRAEFSLLQQVIFNLINNACQSMKESGLLRISTRILKKHVLLSVEDSGMGIENDLKEKIFEPFFTTKEEGVGTGLGLSLSKNIVERFNGKITLQSELGKGSMFTIILPLVQ